MAGVVRGLGLLDGLPDGQLDRLLQVLVHHGDLVI
jgi:hypothetical protein